MARSYRKSNGRADLPGGHGALPRIIWEHPDYCLLSGNAVKLLMDLACQFNGRNNGDLTVAFSVLKNRGWRSKVTLYKARDELLRANLITQTREGRFLNPGGRCALFALTWKPINECPGKGLNLEPTSTPLRKFSLEHNEIPSPEHGLGSVQKEDRRRERDQAGKFVSVQTVDRLRAVT